jgi:carbamate kinase
MFARRRPGSSAVIGALEDLPEILEGTKGTRINTDVAEITFHG